ncbi:MAG: Mur ligase family protein [Kosmotogaceae bacterium]
MLTEVLVSGSLLVFLILFYHIESKIILSTKKKIKIKIAVTGSRGKSTTVKFLCAVLRKAGYRVLGKVTGTEPLLILPDGTIEKIERRGVASILEQKKVLLKKASEVNPDILVTEIMSINPEYQMVESRLLITPDYYIITNIKRDHLGVTGENKKEITEVFLKSAPVNAKILTLNSEKDLIESINTDSSNLSFLDDTEEIGNNELEKKQPGFNKIVLFGKRMCEELGIAESVISETLSEYKFDKGVFSIKSIFEKVFAVNAFNANDVDSTYEIFNNIEENYKDYKKIGIFCTRKDRPERTKSWIESLQSDHWKFDSILVYGPHFLPIKRKKYPFPVDKLEETNLEKFFKRNEKTLFFGFGNYVDSGEQIVKVWNEMEDKI